MELDVVDWSERTGAASYIMPGLQCIFICVLQRLLAQKSMRYTLHCVFDGEFLFTDPGNQTATALALQPHPRNEWVGRLILGKL